MLRDWDTSKMDTCPPRSSSRSQLSRSAPNPGARHAASSASGTSPEPQPRIAHTIVKALASNVGAGVPRRGLPRTMNCKNVRLGLKAVKEVEVGVNAQ